MNDFENDDVSGLLASMKRVEAPGDFDFRVHARIAAGRSVARPWLPISARVAVPAALALLVAGYFGLRSYNSPAVTQASIAPVSVMEQPAPAQPQAPRVIESIPSADDRADGQTVLKPETIEPRPDERTLVPVRDRNPKEEEVGGSRDETLGIGKTRDLGASPKQSLAEIGVATDPSGAVSEVKQNSVAERSGLKPGDLIVSVTAGNIRVRRNGKVIDIPRRP